MRNKKIKIKKKIEKTHAKEKQSHAQDGIYVDWQFAYVHRVAGISLLSGKSTKHGYSFSLTQETQQQQTLITKLRFLHLAHKIHNELQNGPKIFPNGVAPEPSGGLSMSTPAWADSSMD